MLVLRGKKEPVFTVYPQRDWPWAYGITSLFLTAVLCDGLSFFPLFSDGKGKVQ